MSEFRVQVVPAITSDLVKIGLTLKRNHSKHAINRVETETVVHYE